MGLGSSYAQIPDDTAHGLERSTQDLQALTTTPSEVLTDTSKEMADTTTDEGSAPRLMRFY